MKYQYTKFPFPSSWKVNKNNEILFLFGRELNIGDKRSNNKGRVQKNKIQN